MGLPRVLVLAALPALAFSQSIDVRTSPATTPATTEASGTVLIILSMTTAPTNDVIVPLASSNTDEGVLSIGSVVFRPGNFASPQTVTVTGQDDAIDDGDVAYRIEIGAASSVDPNYNGLGVDDVNLVNTNDDILGLSVATIVAPPLITDEAGTAVEIVVALTSQPTATVQVSVSTSDTSEARVSPSALLFTPATYSVPQTVTVTGVNDDVADGAVPYQVLVGPAMGGGYEPASQVVVVASNVDDDTRGVVVSPTSGLAVSELGATDVFTVRLLSQPTERVTISVASSDTSEGRVGINQLIFTETSWNIPQTVTLTGVDDTVADGDTAFMIITGAVSGGDYNGLAVEDVGAVCFNNDAVGILVETGAAGGTLTTTEAGGQATIVVSLASAPFSPVQIGLVLSDNTEARLSSSSLVFTSITWNMKQTITVTGLDDPIDDGDIPYTVAIQPPSTTDPDYAAIDPEDVSLTNIDDDDRGVSIVVPATPGTTVTEAGSAGTFSVALASRPLAPVTLAVQSSNTDEITTSASSIVFTTTNWAAARDVVVRGLDDDVVDGDIAVTIQIGPAVSADMMYSGIVENIVFVNQDDDRAGVAVQAPTAGVVTAEGVPPKNTSVLLSLTSRPTADVTLSLTSSDTSEAVVDSTPIVFPFSAWEVGRVVFIAGVDDSIDDGDKAYDVVVSASSSDINYNSASIVSVSGVNTDDDAVGITPSITTVLLTEDGDAQTFALSMASEPTHPVGIFVRSSNPAEGLVTPSLITFDPASWRVPQNVTVTPVADKTADADVTFAVTFDPAASTDTLYDGFLIPSISVVNKNVDVAGVTLSRASILTGEASPMPATFTIALSSKPAADVTVTVASSDTGEGIIADATQVVAPTAWEVPVTISVTGVDDDMVDGDVGYIVAVTLMSADPAYSGLGVPSIQATNVDDDIPGVLLQSLGGADTEFTTTEAGGVGRFLLRLASQPIGSLSVRLESSDTTEGTVAPSGTITPAMWESGLLVEVRGVDDGLVDGDVDYFVSAIVTPQDPADGVYAGLGGQVEFTNSDNDIPGIEVSTTANPYRLFENSTTLTASFGVRLTSEPLASVFVPIASSDITEGVVSTSQLEFRPSLWNVFQSVAIVPVADTQADGDTRFTVGVGPPTSSSAPWRSVVAQTVNAITYNMDMAEVLVEPAGISLRTSERGTNTSFTVRLATRPFEAVTIRVASNDTGEVTPATEEIVIAPESWNVAQTVTVVGVDDVVADGSAGYAIVLGPTVSLDAFYTGLRIPAVEGTNDDNDLTASLVVSPSTGIALFENGTEATFDVRLSFQPNSTVTVDITSGDASEVLAVPAQLVFPPAAWNIPQTVVLRGVDDTMVDGNSVVAVTVGPAVSEDSMFASLTANVVVSTLDDDANAPTPAPPTLIPLTPFPRTNAPLTAAPVTPVPATPIPATASPSAVLPSTLEPVTASPLGASEEDDDFLGLPLWAAILLLVAILLCCLALLYLLYLLCTRNKKNEETEPTKDEREDSENRRPPQDPEALYAPPARPPEDVHAPAIRSYNTARPPLIALGSSRAVQARNLQFDDDAGHHDQRVSPRRGNWYPTDFQNDAYVDDYGGRGGFVCRPCDDMYG